MSIILVLIPLGLVLVGIAVWAFFWAADHDQFEDLEAQGTRVLEDGERDPGDAP
jgi:cbb3-type cytochrome oxidase maturation protein